MSNQRSTTPFKFTPGDFYNDDEQGLLTPLQATLKANHKLQTEMSKWVKVYSCTTFSDGNYSKRKNPGDNQYLYLTPPQLIESPECGHIPFIKFNSDYEGVYPQFAECEVCGVKLEAQWTLVKKDGANG